MRFPFTRKNEILIFLGEEEKKRGEEGKLKVSSSHFSPFFAFFFLNDSGNERMDHDDFRFFFFWVCERNGEKAKKMKI